jgi:hypothetical protein
VRHCARVVRYWLTLTTYLSLAPGLCVCAVWLCAAVRVTEPRRECRLSEKVDHWSACPCGDTVTASAIGLWSPLRGPPVCCETCELYVCRGVSCAYCMVYGLYSCIDGARRCRLSRLALHALDAAPAACAPHIVYLHAGAWQLPARASWHVGRSVVRADFDF